MSQANRPSIVTGQYASRHGIIDNVARDAMSHRLPNYHLEPQRLGYETAQIGKWHMGKDGMPRPRLNHNGSYQDHRGYITYIMNTLAPAQQAKPRRRRRTANPGRCSSRTKPCTRTPNSWPMAR